MKYFNFTIFYILSGNLTYSGVARADSREKAYEILRADFSKNSYVINLFEINLENNSYVINYDRD